MPANGTSAAAAESAKAHLHDWPLTLAEWESVSRCEDCGMAVLRLFVRSASWAVRRVEHISFRDERTVRRAVSVDYASPAVAPSFRYQGAGEGVVRVLPFALMRRKSLVNFDLRGDDGRPLPLLGLRENQALTLSVARAWAARALGVDGRGGLPAAVDEFVSHVVAGDKHEMKAAFAQLREAKPGDALCALRRDAVFRTVIDRLSSDFLLYSLDRGPVGARHIVKFAYDESLSLRYRRSGFDPASTSIHESGARSVTYEEGALLPLLSPTRWKAALGIQPTLIRFQVPAAELAASYHVEIDAPPEVEIVEAQMLADRPDVEATSDVERDPSLPAGWRRRRRPSFDYIGGGYPTVDLHVADVPYGALSRAQVALQASPGGWLSTAVLSCCAATTILAIAAWRQPETTNDVASSLLVGFAAATLAVLVRPDRHRMLTRLLSGLRHLATLSALLSFAGAAVFAFYGGPHAQAILFAVAGASTVPSLMVTYAWLRARFRRREVEQSPWVQDTPPEQDEDPTYVDKLIEELEADRQPYTVGLDRLGFGNPAIRVKSSEAARREYLWTPPFEARFTARLDD